jgi:glyoxylase-like metal-dependent hydrolase (beta-lactamase superfamily II)
MGFGGTPFLARCARMAGLASRLGWKAGWAGKEAGMTDALRIGPWQVHLLTDCAPAFASSDYAFPNASIAGHPAARWLPNGNFETRFGVVLLRGPAGDMLVDCGVGPGTSTYFPNLVGRLPEALAAYGASLESITEVIFTHLHVDHVGWAPLLPNAAFLVAEAEWAHWSRPDAGLPHHMDAIARCIAPLAEAGRLRVVADDSNGRAAVAPGLALLAAPGHTPGHHAVLLDDALLIAGDLWHNPAQIEVPAWCHRADRDPAQSTATRSAMAARAAAAGWLVAAGHFTRPNALGRIRSTAEGLEFVPTA